MSERPARRRGSPASGSGPAAAAPAGVAGWYREPVALAIVLVVLTRVAMALVLPAATEDAYITFRYARNLVEGHGLVFNPGERVMGYTSPLWTMWCALGIAWFKDPLVWTRVSAIAADLVTVILLVPMLSRHATRAAAWCFAVAFGAWPFFSALAASGMESSLLLALAVTSAWAVERRHPSAGPALAALALTRPEGLLCALPIAWRAGGRDRIVALALTVAGYGALAWYYGTPIPNSALAKTVVYGMPGPLVARHWWEWIAPPAFLDWPRPMEGLEMFQLRVLLAPAAVLGMIALWRTPLVGLALGAVAGWAMFALPGAPYFYWYMALPLFATFLLASAGLPRVLRGRAVYIALALLVLGTWTVEPKKVYRLRADTEHHLFALTADQLASTSRPGDTVFLEPLGFIGWANPALRIHDEIGLVTPGILRGRRQNGWYADYVERERPTWIVVRYGLFDSGKALAGYGAPFRDAAERQRVFAAYHETAQTAPKLDDTEILILRRNQP